MTYLTYSGKSGGSGGGILRKCLFVLLGIAVLALAFVFFSFVIAAVLLFIVFRLVKRFFFGAKPAARTATPPPPAAAAIPPKQPAFAQGEIVDVPYTDMSVKPDPTLQPRN